MVKNNENPDNNPLKTDRENRKEKKKMCIRIKKENKNNKNYK